MLTLLGKITLHRILKTWLEFIWNEISHFHCQDAVARRLVNRNLQHILMTSDECVQNCHFIFILFRKFLDNRHGLTFLFIQQACAL